MKAPVKNRIIKTLATGFGSGLSPVVPGTMGTAVGVLVCLISTPLPLVFRMVFVAAIAGVSIYVAGRAEALFKIKDDQRIVIDEIAGFQVAMLPVAITSLHLLGAFVLFRLFDIWKPFPLHRLQNLPGGWGIVADDLGAGVYAGICLFLITISGIL